jgi:hypothetical protein
MTVVRRLVQDPRPDKEQWTLYCEHDSHASITGDVADSLPRLKAQARHAGWHVEDVYLVDGSRNMKTVVLCPHHARSRAVCEHEPKHKVWKAQDGEVAVCKMSTNHLENAVPFIDRVCDGLQKKQYRLQREIEAARALLSKLSGEQSQLAVDILKYRVIETQMSHELHTRQKDYGATLGQLVAQQTDDTYWDMLASTEESEEKNGASCIFCIDGACYGDCR